MSSLLSRIGAFAYRRRLFVVLIWLFVLIGGGVGAVTLSGATTNSFSIPGQESTTAQEHIKNLFGSAAVGGATAQVVIQAPDGQTLTNPKNTVALTDLVATLGQLPGVVSATNPLDPAFPTVDADQDTAYSTVTYSAIAGEVTPEDQESLAAAVTHAQSTGLTVAATGQALQEPVHLGGVGEIAGVIIALLVLALTYGSLVTAGMNLLTAVVGVGIGVLGITIATGFLELNATTTALAGMLGLAVGIDYCLFIVSRFRNELRRGSDVANAVAIAVGTAGSAVVTAAVTVVIALVGLFVAGIPFLTQMGIAAAATIVVAVLVALTLVPAVLGFIGRRALPRSQREMSNAAPVTDDEPPRGRGFLAGWIDLVIRRRVLAVLIPVLLLGSVAVPWLSLRTTLVQSPAAGSDAAQAQDMLADGFGEGFNGPLTLLFEGQGAAHAAAAATPGITALADVITVTAPIPNAEGTAALLTIIPASGPSSEATETLVHDLRSKFADVNGVRAAVTGATAVSVDVAASLNKALPIYLVLIVGLALILLVLVFRSILVPVVGVLGFLLTTGAALGASVAVFQWGWLSELLGVTSVGPLISLTPILVIGILFGLAMDYQIFLVSRMHEAHSHGRPAIDAVRTGFRQAAPVVVAAALIMLAVFGGFFTGDDPTIKSIAFALAVGILADAFIVRMVLVPAALALLGDKAWWLPSWLRWLPHLDVEGAALTAPTTRGRHAAATTSA